MTQINTEGLLHLCLICEICGKKTLATDDTD